MSETPREYDREFTDARSGPLRVRTGFSTDRGAVTRFVVQLEYHHGADDWRPVVRYDHDAGGSSEAAHDVTDGGLHIDIYRDGEKHATEFVSPPQPAAQALNFAEEHLSRNIERYTKRYEAWHEINSQ